MRESGAILDFSGQVRSIACEVKRSLALRVDLRDLYQAGWLGLIKAWERFDPSKRVPFSGYARFRIRGAILDSLREDDYFSRNARRRWRRMEAAAQRISQARGATAADSEIAEACGESIQTVARLRYTQHFPADAVRLLDRRAEAPEQAIYRAEMMRRIRGAGLPSRSLRVLELRYFDDLSLKRIGSLMGVSEGRVCQIQMAALQTLRERLQPARAANPRDPKPKRVPVPPRLSLDRCYPRCAQGESG